MIDVNKITSMLAKLGDPQLQQYAQMHKNDPYIMSLAMSESNRRKEVRSAGQGAQGMQEQPKVVDQEIARMGDMQNASPEQMARLSQLLEARKQAEYKEFTGGGREQPIPQQQQQLPEDQGIGQLPAGNMDFASGGIIAFADGGDVERYQSGGMSFIDRLTYGNITPAERARREKLQAEANAGRLLTPYEQERAANMATVTAGSTYTPEAYGVTAPAPLYQNPRRMDPPPAAAAVDNKAAPTANTTRRVVPNAAPITAAATDPSAKPDTGGLDTLMAEYERKQDLARGASKNADVQYASSLRGEATKLVADEEKRIKDQIDPYKDRETRLLKQEKGLEGMGDKYLGLALLQAGAAMMTTPGGVGVALGKGVQVGSERYVQGIEKINAAKDKFAEARDRLDDLRLNRADMNARDIRAAKTEARTLERQAEGLFYTGTKEYLKMTDKNLTTLLGLAADNLKTDKTLAAEATQTDKRIKSAEGIARLQAQTATMPTGADRTAMMLGTGDTPAARLESGMRKLQEITADKSGMAAVKVLADINAKRQPGEATVTMEDLLKGAREFSSLMYGPKVADVAPTRDRPR